MKPLSIAALGLMGPVFFVILWIAMVLGWIFNVVKIVGLWGADVNLEVVVRIVGVLFVPLGGVIGWF
jgi:hypothetical protein